MPRHVAALAAGIGLCGAMLSLGQVAWAGAMPPGLAVAVDLVDPNGPATVTSNPQANTATLSFPVTRASATRSVELRLRNYSSNTASTLRAVRVIGTNAAEFSISNSTCPVGNFPVAAICTFRLNFSPTSEGAKSATIDLGYDHQFNLNGRLPVVATAIAANAAGIEFDPARAPFVGQVQVGLTGNPVAVSVRNIGAAPLTVSQVRLVPTGAATDKPADFLLSNNTCAAGAVAPNGTCAVAVSFRPSALAAGASFEQRTVGLEFVSNAGNGTVTMALSAGAVPAVGVPEVAPAEIIFEATPVGRSSAAREIVVTNKGAAALALGTPSSTQEFSRAAGDCGSSLAPGAACRQLVRFAPTSTGVKSATLALQFPGASPPGVNVILRGEALPASNAAPQIVVPTGPVELAASVGGTATRSVTVQNSGTAALVVSVASVTGAGLSVTSNGCGSVAAGVSCTIELRFAPSVAGAVTGALTLQHNAAGGSSTVPVQATATAVPAPAIAIGALNPANASALVNGTATQSLTVSNSGGGTLTINAVTAATGAWAVGPGTTCTAATNLAAGATCRIEVVFRPTTAGAQTSSLSITHSAATVPATVALSGTGTLPEPATATGSGGGGGGALGGAAVAALLIALAALAAMRRRWLRTSR